MNLNRDVVLALVAGLALYQLLGPQMEHLRGLVESMVLAELISRVVKRDSPTD
jgi:hypothetical protein